ncbi:MAG: amidohydrolase family protein [Acidimicrobiia bacterium]|nr:amidohydrolase family protein [Acidimicrobiia bacterium]
MARRVAGRPPRRGEDGHAVPEADPGLEATRLLASRGVVVGLGHSRCTYEEALAAADAGATVVTHAFDAMGPLHHRAPGLVGAALEDERLVPTLIGDLAHVHPAVIRLVAAAKARVALVSDAVATAGLVARDGAAFLPDGSLAGSATPLGVALGRVAAAGIPLARAVEMASTVPAGVLDLADRGHLAVGARADVVGLDPATLAVRAVWLRGERVARAPVEERGDG